MIVHIDSPGGTTAGSEQLHGALRGVAAAKPLVVVVDGLAASGGYIAAMSADHIIAQETSLVGSIGVLFQYPNVGELLKLVGVKIEEIKSSPLKAAPNGYEPTSPEARAAIEALVKDSYGWFRGMVKRAPQDGRDRARDRHGRARVHRAAGARAPPGRSARQREDRRGLAGHREGAESRHAGARLAAQAALQRSSRCCISRPPRCSMRSA